MRIFNKLFIGLLLLIMVPVTFVSYMVFHNAKNVIENEVLFRLNSITDQEVDEIEVFFSERKLDLLALQSRDIYKTTFPLLEQFLEDRSNPSYVVAKNAIDRRLTVYMATYGYLDIMLASNEGRVIYVANPAHESEVGTYISSKDDVIKETKTGIYVGEIYKTNIKGHPFSLFMAGQVYGDADKAIGIILIELDAGKIYEFISDEKGLGKSWETLLVRRTSDNKIMFISPLKYEPSAVLTKTITIDSDKALPAQKAVLGENSSGLSIDYRGKEVLSAWRAIPSLGLGFVTKIDSEEAFLPIGKLKKLLSVIIFVTIFCSALAALAIAKSISNPIEELHKGVEIISAGNLDYKVGIDSKDETGQLSMAFDVMTQNLKLTTTSIEKLNAEIAERKKVSSELIKNEKRLKDVVSNMSDWVWETDKNGVYIYCSDQGALLMGRPKEEIIGKTPFDFMAPDEVNNLREVFFDIAARKAPIKDLENWNVTQDGKRICLLTNGVPKLDSGGNLTGYLGVDKDITESKKMQEKQDLDMKQLIKSRAILSSMLEDNNETRERLEGSLKELKEVHGQLAHAEKMEAIGRMASGVAHEVKNPLGIILQGINYFEVALPSEEKDNREMLRMMKDSVKRADNIVRGLLDFSRREELKMEECDINAVIESAVNLVQHEPRFNSIEYVRELADSLPDLLMDKGKIEQVFVNLFTNAMDAMPNGGKICIRSCFAVPEANKSKAWQRKDDSFMPEEKAVIVEVEDTGVGIGEDIIDKIFDPFFTTKNRAEGTGLGLSVSNNIIGMHKGLIYVESEKGKGTKFTIAFKVSGKWRS